MGKEIKICKQASNKYHLPAETEQYIRAEPREAAKG